MLGRNNKPGKREIITLFMDAFLLALEFHFNNTSSFRSDNSDNN